MDQVDPFRCAVPELRAAYKHRHLRVAFCNVQHQKDQPGRHHQGGDLGSPPDSSMSLWLCLQHYAAQDDQLSC